MEHMLQQILQEIKSVKTDVLSLHQDNQSLKNGMQELNQNQILLAERQSQLEKKQLQFEQNQTDLQKNQLRMEENQVRLEQNQVQTNIKISDIHTAVVRLENGQPKDIVALLETFDDYFCEKDSELAILNHRIFRVESRLERMSMRA